MCCVYDYSEPDKPRNHEHRSRYAFPVSDEWKAWQAVCALKKIDQEDLAKFLEEHIVDLVKPMAIKSERLAEFMEQLGVMPGDPAEIFALSKGIQVWTSGHIKQCVNLDHGSQSLTFENENRDQAGNPIKVPAAFVIGIPVFLGGPRYMMVVQLRMKVSHDKGSITWAMKLWRSEVAFEDAFSEAVQKATAETALPVLHGSAEGDR
jgi:uncharacterized protein YfdQ (DUF2303 family)